MLPYTDISILSNNSYKLAELIENGNYDNILYYEFHELIDPSGIHNCFEGLESFSHRADDYYDIFLSYGIVDEQPAIIHTAIKLANEWFIAHDCGANYYLGYGPTGILKLREACFKRNVVSFASTDNFEEWIIKKFGMPKELSVTDKKNVDLIQYEKLIKSFRYLAIDMQRRPAEFQNLSEENIRDQMLTYINMIFKGRGNAEAKNCKGKTDIMVKTSNGLNEHIFELKVWKGVKSLEDTISQLQGYLSWHNNYSGIILFCYNLNFTSILNKTKEYLSEHFTLIYQGKSIKNEFRFRLPYPNDGFKNIETHLFLINLKE